MVLYTGVCSLWLYRYFNDNSEEEEEEEEEGGPEGEGEEAVRARIAKEFHWTDSSEAPPTGGEEGEDYDPLDAFMAGIEVTSLLSILVKH